MKLFLLLVLALFAACSTIPKKTKYMKPDSPAAIEARRDMLVGRWTGEMPTMEGKFYKWLIERRADGGFTLQTMLMEHGKVVHQGTEFGLWGVSGDVYFSMTREMLRNGKTTPLDTNTAHYYDAYEILELGNGLFHYKHLETGNEYRVRHVPGDFQLK